MMGNQLRLEGAHDCCGDINEAPPSCHFFLIEPVPHRPIVPLNDEKVAIASIHLVRPALRHSMTSFAELNPGIWNIETGAVAHGEQLRSPELFEESKMGVPSSGPLFA